MTTNIDLAERWSRVLAPNYATPGLFLATGRGSRVVDVEGREYLDFIAGLAVVSTGHAHPRVVRAIAGQASRLMHVSNLYGTENVVRLAERLTARTGHARAFFCNSGAEANELAVKIARRHAHARGLGESGVLLAADNSFHGRTIATLALQGQAKYREGFGPMPAGFRHVSYNDVAALEAAFAQGDVAALVLEPVQGEGGVVPATREYLQTARRLTREHDALLILDEVQTGIARTGRFLAQEHADIRADVTTLAKGLGGGFPVGAVLMDEAVAGLLRPGDHGCTFGGNPLACAAAEAVLDVIDEEGLVANAEHVGRHLREGLEAVLGTSAADVRGLGLLDAVVLREPLARTVKQKAEDAGLLLNAASDHVLRFAPPLTVTLDEADEAIGILAKILDP